MANTEEEYEPPVELVAACASRIYASGRQSTVEFSVRLAREICIEADEQKREARLTPEKQKGPD